MIEEKKEQILVKIEVGSEKITKKYSENEENNPNLTREESKKSERIEK
jgi:hypothetical protein